MNYCCAVVETKENRQLRICLPSTPGLVLRPFHICLNLLGFVQHMLYEYAVRMFVKLRTGHGVPAKTTLLAPRSVSGSINIVSSATVAMLQLRRLCSRESHMPEFCHCLQLLSWGRGQGHVRRQQMLTAH